MLKFFGLGFIFLTLTIGRIHGQAVQDSTLNLFIIPGSLSEDCRGFLQDDECFHEDLGGSGGISTVGGPSGQCIGNDEHVDGATGAGRNIGVKAIEFKFSQRFRSAPQSLNPDQPPGYQFGPLFQGFYDTLMYNQDPNNLLRAENLKEHQQLGRDINDEGYLGRLFGTVGVERLELTTVPGPDTQPFGGSRQRGSSAIFAQLMQDLSNDTDATSDVPFSNNALVYGILTIPALSEGVFFESTYTFEGFLSGWEIFTDNSPSATGNIFEAWGEKIAIDIHCLRFDWEPVFNIPGFPAQSATLENREGFRAKFFTKPLI